jgi:hypothetical protein
MYPKHDIIKVCGTLGFVFRFEKNKLILTKEITPHY